MSGRTIRECISNWVELNEHGQRGMKKIRTSDTSGSVSYADETLYSYRTPIARYFKEGKHVLVSSHKYSVTTARHVGFARRWADWRTFTVPYLGVRGGYTGELHKDWHEHNVAYLRDQLFEIEDQAIRQYRSAYQDWWRDQLHGRHKDWLDYMRINHVPRRRYVSLATLVGRIEKARQEKWDRYYHPKAVERRERKAAREEAVLAFNLGEKK